MNQMFSENTFADLGIDERILRALDEREFKHPTTVQEKTYPVLKTGQDLLAQSRTGTGKTLAFGIPILEAIKESGKFPQALILTPTRELAIQINDELNISSRYMNLRNTVVYGGSSISDQIRTLKRGVDIVVGTPGRVKDLIERKVLVLDKIQQVVLDEADEMLDMGFMDDLQFILGETPKERQTMLFSATFPKQIRRIANQYLTNPHFIENDTELRANSSIEHFYYECFSRVKVKSLVNILHLENCQKAILFCQTKSETEHVSNALRAEKFTSGFINGDLSQAQRIRVLDQFKGGEIAILVATDVAARGIDIQDITHVINYSVPQQTETYIHRSGRTGRAGKEGESIIMITPSERERYWQLERQSKISFTKREIPTIEEISFVKKERFLDKLRNHEVDGKEYDTFKKYALDLLIDEDPLDLVTKLLGMYSNDLIGLNAGYEVESPKESHRKKREFTDSRGRRDGKDRRDGRGRDRGRERDRGSFGGADSDMQKLYLSIGREQNFLPKDLFKFLNENVSFRVSGVGKIDVFGKFTFFEVSPNLANKVVDELNKVSFKGKKVLCEVAKPRR